MKIESNIITSLPDPLREKSDLGGSVTTALSNDVKNEAKIFEAIINKREAGNDNTQPHASSDNSPLEYVRSQKELAKLVRQLKSLTPNIANDSSSNKVELKALLNKVLKAARDLRQNPADVNNFEELDIVRDEAGIELDSMKEQLNPETYQKLVSNLDGISQQGEKVNQSAEKGINEGALITTNGSNIVQTGIFDDILDDLGLDNDIFGDAKDIFNVAKDIFKAAKAIFKGDYDKGIDILEKLVNKSDLSDEVKEFVSIIAEVAKGIPKIIEDVDNKNYAAAAEKSAKLGKVIVESINDFFVFDAIGEEFSNLSGLDDLEGFLENAEIVAGKVDGIMKNIELGTPESFLKATKESAELASFLTDDYPIVSDLFETISEIPDKINEINEKLKSGDIKGAIQIAKDFGAEVRADNNPILALGFDNFAASIENGTVTPEVDPPEVDPPEVDPVDSETLPLSEFDAEYYLLQYPDIKAAFGNDHEAAQKHFLEHGIQEGRRGSAIFDVKHYLAQNPDLSAAFGNDYEAAQNHFLEHGIKEGRSGSLEFDAKYYLAQYPDLSAAFGNDYEAAQNHFLEHGIKEGRRGSAEFDVQYYLSQNQDVAAAYGDTNYDAALKHWLVDGINQGRTGSADFNADFYLSQNDEIKAKHELWLKYFAEHPEQIPPSINQKDNTSLAA